METSIAAKLATARTRKAKAPKPDTIVFIRAIDMRRGTYSALSSDGRTVYVADVAARSCTCPAGESHFTSCKTNHACKHLLAARCYARGLASIHDAAERAHSATFPAWIKLSRVNIESLDAPLSQPTATIPLPAPIVLADHKPVTDRAYMTAPTVVIPAPDDFMSCYGS